MNNEWGRIKPNNSWILRVNICHVSRCEPGISASPSRRVTNWINVVACSVRDMPKSCTRPTNGGRRKNNIQNLFCNKSRHDLGQITSPYPSPPKKKETHHPYGGSHSCQSNLFLAPNRVVKGVLFVKETLRGLTWLWPLHRTFRCVGRVLTLFDSPLMGAKSCWQRNYCNMWVVSSFFLQASFVHLKWQSFLRFLGCDLKPAAVAWFLGSFKSDAERVVNAAGCAG